MKLLAPALFALALVSGCGGGSDAADAKYTIAVIPKGTTHEFWKSIHAGAAKAGSELEVEVLWKGPGREDDRDDQIKVVESMIARGVDGIVIAPLDDKALVQPLESATREGIPVVVVDSGVDWDGMVSFVATDNHLGGVLAARELAGSLDGVGRVLMLRYLEGSASTAERERGFLETIAAEFPGIEVASSDQYAGATTESAYAKSEGLLGSHPELDGIFCPNESAAFGMLRALQDSGRAGKVRFVGFDASEKLVQGLREGELDGLVIQNPFRMGEDGVRRMVDHLEGRSVAKRIDTGVVMVTRENMDEPEVRALLFPELDRWLK